MKKLSVPEILEKWSHIAMKIFPPQTEIAPASGDECTICIRWKSENDPDTLSTRARGVDLQFSEKMLTDYISANAEMQLRQDALIETEISQRLRDFKPYSDCDARPQIEKWLIARTALVVPP